MSRLEFAQPLGSGLVFLRWGHQVFFEEGEEEGLTSDRNHGSVTALHVSFKP